jgi:hypothetical protein
MNNQVCTPATARRLREQGFPQPVPEPGQVWLMQGRPVFICAVENKGSHIKYTYCRIGETYTGFTVIATDFDTYLATAPDILRELGSDYSLDHWATFDKWYCHGNKKVGADPNPAEACAMAWEAKQKRG